MHHTLLAVTLVACTGSGTDMTDTDTAPTDQTTGDTGEPTGPSGPIADVGYSTVADFAGPFIVQWTQATAGPATIEYEIDGEWRSTPEIDAVAGTNRASVLGVPLGTSAPYRVVSGENTVDGAEDLVDTRMPSVPDYVIEANDDTRWDDDYVMIPAASNFSNGAVMIVDRLGRIVWAVRTGVVYYSQTLDAGTIVWGDITRGSARRAYLDQRIDRIQLDDHYHAMIELDDGTVAWDGASLIQRAPGATSGTEVSAAFKPFYVNGISFSTAQDAYIVSEFDESIFAIERPTGNLLWNAPSTSGGPRSGVPTYSFVPEDSQFINQHGAQMLDNGNLLVSTETGSTGVGMREYSIDHKKGELTLVWDYASGLFDDASWSWAFRLDNGNSLHTVNSSAIVYEVTSDETVAWRLDFTEYADIGRAQVIDDLYDFAAPTLTVEKP